MNATTGLCRAGCGEPLDASLAEGDGTGLHPGCVAPLAPVLPALAGILQRHQADQPRSRQRRIGPSQIGEPCDRALAYRLAGVPEVRDEGLKWAPLVGTWAHAGIAEALHQENARLGRQRYMVEQRVTVSEELGIGGTVDCYDTDTGEIIDWKLTGRTRVDHYRRHGPGEVYRTQVQLYGLGWHNAGQTPRSVRLALLPKWSRSLLDGYEWAEPFDPDVAQAALTRLRRLRYLVDALGVQTTPANWALIPGQVGNGCSLCDWRRPGGPADATGCPGNTTHLKQRAEASFGKGLVA
jgi:hypothetical protein